MKKRLLLPLPLLAALCGERIDPPALRPDIAEGKACRELPAATEKYLLAYALRIDDTRSSMEKAIESWQLMRQCRAGNTQLEHRLLALFNELCPSAGSGPRRCP